MRVTLFVVLGLSSVVAPRAYAADPQCGPHQHVVAEKDDDEGGSVKRCVCDDGFVAASPGAACRPAKAAAKPAKSAK